jgi:hypothetical protein
MGVNGNIQNTRNSHQSNCEYLGVSWFSPFVWSCVLLVSGIFCFPLLLESTFEDASSQKLSHLILPSTNFNSKDILINLIILNRPCISKVGK